MKKRENRDKTVEDANAGWIEDTLTLCKEEIPVKLGRLPQAELKFYPENPRLYSIVHAGDAELPSQLTIEKKLGSMEHVKQLVQSIRVNAGLTDPLIVRDGDYVVLEGNSRLAAYRLLAKNNAIKWGMVKCKLLPKDISEDMVFALLGEYHIIGKKDWAPYEQAGYLYRRKIIHGVEPATIAKEMGLSTRYVSQMIKVYDFMVKHEDNDVSKWSYYEEYLRHNPIKKVRRANPAFDKAVVSKIKSGEIPRAVDVRQKVTKIAAAGKKVVKQFIERDNSLEHSYDRAIAKGTDNPWYKRLNKFRRQIADPDVQDNFNEMNEGLRKKCIYELKKIKQAVKSLAHRIE